MEKQNNLFEDDFSGNDWEQEYIEMPEYNNKKQPDPLIIATFKFRNEEDYLEFKNIIQKYAYEGEKVFDGMQQKDKKSSWYPHKEKASKYEYL